MGKVEELININGGNRVYRHVADMLDKSDKARRVGVDAAYVYLKGSVAIKKDHFVSGLISAFIIGGVAGALIMMFITNTSGIIGG